MELNLEKQGFKPVANPGAAIPDCVYLAKRQTLNTNRAVCVVQLDQMPADLKVYLKSVRSRVAFKVGFFPIFWGLGLQVVLVCPGITSTTESVLEYVAKFDNQWAIIQSVFFVDPDKWEFKAGRSWGQFLTGKYQEEIFRQLQVTYRDVST
ncbi:MAG: hypothetical protein OEZ39_16045 [Gammaproteobacteria bacterium]|nr:hypothetical protein [Gammaproteobacteria bacterium]MDH5653370.1 hypothetical protein [Gammaproteobacteria bacterium]